jgi:hypothetical protein
MVRYSNQFYPLRTEKTLEFKSGLGAAAPGTYRARSTFDTKGKWLAKLLINLSSGGKINAEFPFEVR